MNGSTQLTPVFCGGAFPSPKLRIALGLLAAGLSAGACGLFGRDTAMMAPSGPLPPGSAVSYTAVGASDVAGIGASRPCLELFGDCPDSTGYVFVAARQLRTGGRTVSVNNRGLPTAVISRRVQDLSLPGDGDAVANLIMQAMPFVPAASTFVTIFAGANDVNVIIGALGRGAGGANPTAFIDDQIRAFGADYTTLVDGIRQRAPNARLVALNLPNMGALPFVAGATLPHRQAAQRLSVGITRTVINALAANGVRVVDLMCDARFYNNSTYSPDGFHPNDAGYAIFADQVVRAATEASYPAPRDTCPQMTLVP